MKTIHLSCLLLALVFVLSCDNCCEPELPPSNTERLCLYLGAGVWPSDYFPTSGCFFTPNILAVESITVSVSQVQIINGSPQPVGGSGTMNFDLTYLNGNGWCVDVWKNREYIVKITMVQSCGLCCSSDIWQQTNGGDVHVSCFTPGEIKWGKTQWSFYKHVTSYPISSLTVTPSFVKCLDCGCK